MRALVNDTRHAVHEAGPSEPVEVLGFDGAPDAGDRLAVVENESRAREVADYRARQKRDKHGRRASRHARLARADDGAAQDRGPQGIPAGHQGRRAGFGRSDRRRAGQARHRRSQRAGAACRASAASPNPTSRWRKRSGAAIIGFNVRAHKEARDVAERDGVEIRYYNIIYNLIDDVKAAMSGMLAPTMRETFLGNAEILEVFNISKVGKVAGCRVTDGVVQARRQGAPDPRQRRRSTKARSRTLKRFKDEVKEVRPARNAAWPSRTTRTCTPAT